MKCWLMSALGQKRTCALQLGMSALPPIATAKADSRKRSCPLCPRKRTCAVQLGMSALGQKRTCRSLDQCQPFLMTGGHHVPSSTDGRFSFGQYERNIGMNPASGGGQPVRVQSRNLGNSRIYIISLLTMRVCIIDHLPLQLKIGCQRC